MGKSNENDSWTMKHFSMRTTTTKKTIANDDDHDDDDERTEESNFSIDWTMTNTTANSYYYHYSNGRNHSWNWKKMYSPIVTTRTNSKNWTNTTSSFAVSAVIVPYPVPFAPFSSGLFLPA